MPAEQFEFMRDVLAAPSPVNLEGAMTYGVLKPYMEKNGLEDWAIHQFKGNASIVQDTHPEDDGSMLSVMIIGHADKIRLQVRSIGDDGKIWINSDSFLPCTLIGHQVKLFSQDEKKPGNYRVISGGTVEAIGAIHFADAQVRSGDRGIKANMLYLELHIHGENKRAQVEDLGIRPGDTLILDRPIQRGFSPDTFYGAYLDNGLGCFTTAEVARLVAEAGGTKNIRCLFAMATHEEIGRFGSRVLVGELMPDVVIAVDVNHDYVAAPGISDRRQVPLSMGDGFTLTCGSIASEFLNQQIETAAQKAGIPYQVSMSGRDTGTDGMAAVLAGVDSAATSLGFPTRNMHTISETGHTGDVLACAHAIKETLLLMDKAKRGKGLNRDDFENGHPRLDEAKPISHGG